MAHHEHQASVSAHRSGDIGKGGERIGKGHHPETADAEVEMRCRKRVILRIAQLERDIPQSFFRTALAGELKHLFGDIHADRASLPRGAGSVPRGLPCTAADIEHAR